MHVNYIMTIWVKVVPSFDGQFISWFYPIAIGIFLFCPVSDAES